MLSSSLARTSPPVWLAEVRATLTLAWPLIFGQIAYKIQLTTNIMLMGWLGPTDLAAGMLAMAVINPILVFANGVASAVAPLSAQTIGRGQVGDAGLDGGRRYLQQGLWYMIFIAAMATPLFMNIGPLLLLLGQEPALVERSAGFARIIGLMALPHLMIAVFRNFLAAHRLTNVVLVVVVGGSAFNFGLGYMLTRSGLGLTGIGFGTIMSNVLMVAVLIVYMATKRSLRMLRCFEGLWRIDGAALRQLSIVGLPIGVTVLSEVGLFSASSFLMGTIGADELAAYAVASQFVGLAFAIPTGIGIAAMVRVGWAYGRGDARAVRWSGWTSIALVVVTMGFTSATYFLFPHALVSFFLDARIASNRGAFDLAVQFLALVGMLQLADGLQGVSSHVLRGMSDTFVPMILAIVGYWPIGFVVAFTLVRNTDVGGPGVYFGLLSGLSFSAITMTLRFHFRNRAMLRGSRTTSIED